LSTPRTQSRNSISALAWVLLVSCGGGPEPLPFFQRQPGYDGPPVEVRRGLEDRLPGMCAQFRVPTSGYVATLRDTVTEGDSVTIRITLIKPGEGEVVAALATTVEAAFPELVLRHEKVVIAVQQIQRGVSYVVDPEFVPALVARRGATQ
jgi:hypothetical protein